MLVLTFIMSRRYASLLSSTFLFYFKGDVIYGIVRCNKYITLVWR